MVLANHLWINGFAQGITELSPGSNPLYFFM
jgi:hypothetical protein